MVGTRFSYLLATSLLLAACGSSSSGGAAGGNAGGADTTGAGGAGGAAVAKPDAPALTVVMPMATVLHVAWTTTMACDSIVAERKDPNDVYAVAFTVDGSKVSHMDGGAYKDLMYTYRLQCKVGNVLSDYSNEMSTNPTVTSP